MVRGNLCFFHLNVEYSYQAGIVVSQHYWIKLGNQLFLTCDLIVGRHSHTSQQDMVEDVISPWFQDKPAYRTQAVQNAAATWLSNTRDLYFLVNFGVLQGDSNHSNLSLLTEIIQNDLCSHRFSLVP